tara:strand:- start:1638 stop:1946 length:309 start_codon:yes stop_codon:yes gene_type:complete
MAAVDLTTLNWSNGGANWKQSSVGTTNQEFKLPKWAKLVTVKPAGQDIVFSYDGTDGAAPSSHAFPHPVDAIIQYNPVQTAQERSIYIASSTGTATIYLIFE